MNDRNQYGFPTPGHIDTVDPGAPLTCERAGDYLPVAELADDEEPETWREELTPDERAMFDEIMNRAIRAVSPDVPEGNIAWVVEEALWQLRCIADNATTLHVPGAGAWKRCR